jgi:hypothetical protein
MAGDQDATASDERALVVAMPRRHLDAAAALCRDRGRVTIPAGGPGDLDRTAPGTEVLVLVIGEDEVPAVTWRATFLARVEPEAGRLPDRLPATWVREHGGAAPGPGAAEPALGVDDDEDEDEEDRAGPQAFFEVRGLEALPTSAWVFANELVRKQDRGGRAFLPRVPRLIRRPA